MRPKKCNFHFFFFAFLASFAFRRSTMRLNLNANNTKNPLQIFRYLMALVATFRQTISDNHILLFEFFVLHWRSPSNALISIHTLLPWFGTMHFYWGSDLTLECQNQPLLQPLSSGPHPSPQCLDDTASRHELTHLRPGTCWDVSLKGS